MLIYLLNTDFIWENLLSYLVVLTHNCFRIYLLHVDQSSDFQYIGKLASLARLIPKVVSLMSSYPFGLTSMHTSETHVLFTILWGIHLPYYSPYIYIQTHGVNDFMYVYYIIYSLPRAGWYWVYVCV